MRLLQTKEISLRPVEFKDLEKLIDLQWDKDTMSQMNFVPIGMESQKRWLESLNTDKKAVFCVFAFDILVGLATLNNINRLHQSASWGIKINSRGLGYGFQAALILLHYGFSFLNLNRIYGDRIKGNKGSIYLCKKLGIQEEGTLRRHYFHGGEFRDVTIVGILRDEFYNHNLKALKELQICE